MPDQPDLSPHLRPIRYCPNCGQRVAQKAETCFMCGYDFQAGERRRLRLPVGDLILIVVVLGVAYLWWTRSPREDVSAAQPAITATPSATATVAAAAPPTRWPTATAAVTTTVSLTGTAPITSGIALTSTAAITPTVAPTPIVYVVKRGDTVEKIAAQYGVSRQDLMEANAMKNDLLQVDQKLTIPAGPMPRGPDGKIIPTATATPKSGLFKVLVREGDTIDSIAKRMGSSAEAIVQANEAIASADTIIRPGDLLNVPVGTVTFTPADLAAAMPTATFVPTPTPTPGLRWPAPQLMTPLEGAKFSSGEVLLQWLSVGSLALDEVYVVRIVPQGQSRARTLYTTVTTGTSFRVPVEWLKQQARRSSGFSWTVQVARDARAIAGQEAGLLAASPISASKRFEWVEAAGS
jgi:LysM repeat protein